MSTRETEASYRLVIGTAPLSQGGGTWQPARLHPTEPVGMRLLPVRGSRGPLAPTSPLVGAGADAWGWRVWVEG